MMAPRSPGNATRAVASAGFCLLALTSLALEARAQGVEETVNDPWEGMNRSFFNFNDRLDRWFLEPVAKGWDFLLPHSFQVSLRNVTDNARFPVVFLNDLLQLRFGDSLEDVSRFVVNTSVGIGGLFDPATHWGLEDNNEDFGQTLGHWGMPPGPYLVLPIFGPSSPRDAVGRIADGATQVHPYFLNFVVNLAIGTTDVVNRRTLLLDIIREERAQAFDFYASVRNAYIALRENQIRESETPDDESTDDLYYIEESEDLEDLE